MIKICNIHFELPRREPKANFWLTDRLIPTENKKIFFQLSTRPHIFFGTSPVTSTENLIFHLFFIVTFTTHLNVKKLQSPGNLN